MGKTGFLFHQRDMVVTGRGQGMPPCLFLGGVAVRLPQGPVWWGLPCPALCQPFIFHQSEMHWVQSIKWGNTDTDQAVCPTSPARKWKKLESPCDSHFRAFAFQLAARCVRTQMVVQVFPGFCSCCLQMLSLRIRLHFCWGLQALGANQGHPSVSSGVTCILDSCSPLSPAEGSQAGQPWRPGRSPPIPRTNRATTAGWDVWKRGSHSTARPGFKFLRLPERPPPWSFNPSPSVLPATCSLNLVTSTSCLPQPLWQAILLLMNKPVLPHQGDLERGSWGRSRRQ